MTARASRFWGRRRYAVIIVLLAGLAMWGCGPMRRTGPSDGAPRVDGARALERVEGLVGLGPRPAGSPGAKWTAEWIAAFCMECGGRPQISTWGEDTVTGRRTFRNVTVVIPGRRRQRVILGSHYDTKELPGVPGFIGANDSGSSTGLLLEIVRTVAAAERPPPWTLECVFFDGEECQHRYGPRDGLHGSRQHAGQIRVAGRGHDYRAMILLDMVGDRDLSLTLPADTDPGLARLAFACAEALGIRDQIGWFRGGDILDDHVPFADLGLPVINLIDFEYGPGNAWWHTSEDTLDKLSADSLAAVGNLVLELIWRLPAR